MELGLTSAGFSDEEAATIIIRRKMIINVLRKIPVIVARVYLRKLLMVILYS